MNIAKNEIVDDLISYAANMEHHVLEVLVDEDDAVANEIIGILASFEREWNSSDADGDDPFYDDLLDKTADEILICIMKRGRINAGLTQQSMSDLLGIPLRTIENWESGKRTPPEYVSRLIIEKLESLSK